MAVARAAAASGGREGGRGAGAERGGRRCLESRAAEAPPAPFPRRFPSRLAPKHPDGCYLHSPEAQRRAARGTGAHP